MCSAPSQHRLMGSGSLEAFSPIGDLKPCMHSSSGATDDRDDDDETSSPECGRRVTNHADDWRPACRLPPMWTVPVLSGQGRVCDRSASPCLSHSHPSAALSQVWTVYGNPSLIKSVKREMRCVAVRVVRPYSVLLLGPCFHDRTVHHGSMPLLMTGTCVHAPLSSEIRSERWCLPWEDIFCLLGHYLRSSRWVRRNDRWLERRV